MGVSGSCLLKEQSTVCHKRRVTHCASFPGAGPKCVWMLTKQEMFDKKVYNFLSSTKAKST